MQAHLEPLKTDMFLLITHIKFSEAGLKSETINFQQSTDLNKQQKPYINHVK